MKILVFPHHLEIGGSQANAVDLAHSLQGYGHDVVFFATPGPAAAWLHERGLRLIPAPAAFGAPSPRMMAALARAVREQRPDVVHAWEWPQCLNAFLALAPLGVPFVGSDMNNLSVSSQLPKSAPMTFGTEETLEAARALGHRRLLLLEPPVDTGRDGPGAVDGAPFRARHGVGAGDLLVVAVSRLVGWLKLEGLARGIDAVGALADRHPVRFVVVGSGTAEADLRSRAAGVNEAAGREVVSVPGPLLDPREAYAAADVVLGMGGSALRGLSFGKPVVVVGENGFSELATPETVGPFLWRGYYGVGDGAPSDLVGQLERVLADAGERARLGSWARALVERRYALSGATRRLDGFLHEAVGFAGGRLARLPEAAAMGSRSAAARLAPDGLKERLRGRRPANWVEVALARGTQNR